MNKNQSGIPMQGKGPEDLLVLLEEAQGKLGHLSPELMTEVAESLDIPLSDVYGVATFYSFLSTRPQGKNVIRICKSLPCLLKNGETLAESVAREIGINPGETTADGRFSFELTNCIGACDKAPAMLINHDVHGDLTPGKVAQILRSYE